MIEHFKHMIEGLSHPPIRHAAMVHFPIALATVALGLAVASAIMRKNVTMRWVTFIVLLVLVAASWVARQSGEDAEHAIARILPANVHDIASEHEDMGKSMILYSGAAAALALITLITRKRVQLIGAWLTALACAAAMGWVSVTAHLGGSLVYHHGVGTPQAETSRDTAAAVQDQGSTSTGASAQQIAFFRDQVAPILAQNCIGCHNPRRASAGKSAQLDQTSRESMLTGGRSGPAIVPGKPDESLLIHRIRGDLPNEDIMPPDGKLSDEQIAVLAQWIKDGAVWAAAPAQPPG